MLGLPVGGLPPGLELLLQAWANWTGALGDGWGGAERDRTTTRQETEVARSWSSSEGVTRRGVKQKMEAEPSSMVADFNHLLTGRRETAMGLPKLNLHLQTQYQSPRNEQKVPRELATPLGHGVSFQNTDQPRFVSRRHVLHQPLGQTSRSQHGQLCRNRASSKQPTRWKFHEIELHDQQ